MTKFMLDSISNFTGCWHIPRQWMMYFMLTNGWSMTCPPVGDVWHVLQWVMYVMLTDWWCLLRSDVCHTFFCTSGDIYIFFLFIKALQHKCWRSVGRQVLQPAKDVKLAQYVWKVTDRRKNPWCTRTASNLQPSDLRSNAYRSLPGDQDIFSLLFSYIYIHRNPRKWLIILKYFYISHVYQWGR